MKLEFKAHFECKLLDGSKIHTIRRGKGRKIKQGTGLELMHKEREMAHTVCTGTQRVFMTYQWGDYLSISVGAREITHKEQEDLAFNSGFESYDDFYMWFFKKIEAHPDELYSGRIIHWTDKRY